MENMANEKRKKKSPGGKSYIQIITEQKKPQEDEFISCDYCGSLMSATSIKMSQLWCT
jgi:hypothetical protein